MVRIKHQLYDIYNQPEPDPEMNDGLSMTEQVYIPLKDQIEEMTRGGQILEAYRKELYHFGPDDVVDEEFEDVTAGPNFDAADAYIIQARLLGKRDRLAKLAEAEQRAKEAEAKRIEAEAAKKPVGEAEEGQGET